MAEDANMTHTNNLLSGQEISVEYLIEKAVETAVNKALVKVDEFVHRAAEKAFNEAFAKFSKRFNELQSSLPIEQNQQEAVDGERAAAAAQTVINELEESAQETMKIEETASVSTWNTEEKAAALQTTVNDPEEPSQETMEMEEAMDVSLQDVEEDENEDNSEDSSENEYNAPWAYPSPGSIYAIHMDRGSILAANEDAGHVTRIFLNTRNGKMKSKYCHWLCIGGLNDSFHFRNVATGMYLGADPVRSYRRLPVLTVTSTDLGVNTRFHLQGLYRDRLRVQIQVGRGLYYVAAKYYPRSNGLNLICTKRTDNSHMIWLFRKII